MLDLRVCEPALGSGAFLVEAINQLAAQYLTRRQKELGRRIDPEAYAGELQKVKAYLALHNCYGVDLNATAVELAEITLWLDAMHPGLRAPWFGLHLRRGNSLIGGRRETWTPGAAGQARLADDRADGPPARRAGRADRGPPLPAARRRLGCGGRHQGGQGGPAERDGGAQGLAADGHGHPDQRRAEAPAGPRAAGRGAVGAGAATAGGRGERDPPRTSTCGAPTNLPVGTGAVQREQIEASLTDPNSAYRRLRRVMDAWAALWFWPITTSVPPPTREEWIGALEALLGTMSRTEAQQGRGLFADDLPGPSWTTPSTTRSPSRR